MPITVRAEVCTLFLLPTAGWNRPTGAMSNQQLSKMWRLPAAWKRRLPVVWAVSIGVAFSLAVFFVVRWWEFRDIEKAFRLAAEDRATAVKGTFETELAMLELIRTGLMTDGKVERDEFREILAPFPPTRGASRRSSGCPASAAGRRAEFEAAAAARRLPGVSDHRVGQGRADGPGRSPRRILPGLLQRAGAVRQRRRRLRRAPRSRPARGPLPGPRHRQDGGQRTHRASCRTRPNWTAFWSSCRPTITASPSAALPSAARTCGDSCWASSGPTRCSMRRWPSFNRKGSTSACTIPRRRPTAGRSISIARGPGRATGQPRRPSRLYDPKGMDFRSPARRGGASVDDRLPADARFRRRPADLLALGRAGGGAGPERPAGGLHLGQHRPPGVRRGIAAGEAALRGRVGAEGPAQTAHIRRAQEEVIHRLLAASQWRDEETGMHVRRVGLWSELLAKAAGWPVAQCDCIRQAAPMHDVGKIGIPDAILRKPDKLTPAEFEVMKTHTLIGADMLAGSNVPMLQMAREIALNHHERWDGQGLSARAGRAGHPRERPDRGHRGRVRCADARPRLPAGMPEEQALTILQAGAGHAVRPAPAGALLPAPFGNPPHCRAVPGRAAERTRCRSNRPPLRSGRDKRRRSRPLCRRVLERSACVCGGLRSLCNSPPAQSTILYSCQSRIRQH